MATAVKSALHPRKSPRQKRSSVTVDAILQAAIQVLLLVGKERLTTTRVAARAGVSVGTLYQYFPNKSALLQATLKRHINAVSGAIDEACRAHRGEDLTAIADAIADAYLHAKMVEVKASAALYAVSSDVDGMAIARAAGLRGRQAIADVFATARDGLNKDPELVASMVMAMLNGVSRQVLESKRPEEAMGSLRKELRVLLRDYLATCVLHPVDA